MEGVAIILQNQSISNALTIQTPQFFFREINEIIEELVSKKWSDKTDTETTLIKYLNNIKYEIKIASMEKIEMKLGYYEPMGSYFMAIYNLLEEEIKQNNCYLATKVNRALLKLMGKFFQGNASLISAQILIIYYIAKY